MAKSLDQVKQQVSTRYLGRAGIHSIGISRKENAVRVYVQPDDDDEFEDVLKEIRLEAAPYEVVAVKSGRPSIT